MNASGAGFPLVADFGGLESYAPTGYRYCISRSMSGWTRINTNLWPDTEPNYDYCEILTSGAYSPFLYTLLPPTKFRVNWSVGIWRGTVTAVFYDSVHGQTTRTQDVWVASKGGGTILGVNLDVFTDGSDSDIEVKPTAGAAQMLYTSLQPGYHDANIRIAKADSYSLFARKYNTTSTPVQDISYQIFLGEASIRTGPPAHLRPSDFLQLRSLNK